MSIITIRGQLGSGAPEIGKLIADKLHADYVDREIIAKVASLLSTDEQDVIAKEMPPGSFLSRIAETFRHGYVVGDAYTVGIDYSGVYLPTWEISLDDNSYLAGLQSIIKELAGIGSVVIRGRGSQFILKGYPGVFHVSVVAPLEMRVNRVMDSLKLDEKSARKEITRSDSSRREFTKKYFQAELEDPVNYDLVINTEHLDFEVASSIIVGVLPFKTEL